MSNPPVLPWNRQRFRAALFDLDGTLIRTTIDFPLMRQEIRALSSRYDVLSATEGTDDILAMIVRIAEALGGDTGEYVRREALATVERIEEQGCRVGEVIAGARELLETLQAQEIKVGIVTRNSRRIARSMLERTALPHDVLIAREDSREFKPHPEPLEIALGLLGASPDEATMTGDLWADIAAGKAAGLGVTIGIQWPSDPPDRFARCAPDIIVDSLESVFSLLAGPISSELADNSTRLFGESLA